MPDFTNISSKWSNKYEDRLRNGRSQGYNQVNLRAAGQFGRLLHDRTGNITVKVAPPSSLFSTVIRP